MEHNLSSATVAIPVDVVLNDGRREVALHSVYCTSRSIGTKSWPGGDPLDVGMQRRSDGRNNGG